MAKKPVIELTKEYLRRYGWVFSEMEEPGEKEGALVAPWRGMTGEPHMLVIDPIAEKNVLIFTVREIVRARQDETPADRLRDLWLALVAANFRTILGAWAYDPRDGEVVFKFAIPTHGDAYEYEDFEHCMAVVQLGMEVEVPKLKAILDGTRTVREILEADGLGAAVREPVGPAVI